MNTHLLSCLQILAIAGAIFLVNGCGPPFLPEIGDARWVGNLYNGGLPGKRYELTQDVAIVREPLKRPVLAPTSPAAHGAVVRIAGPSRALAGSWGVWGKRHLAGYQPKCEHPCQVSDSCEIVTRGVRIRIEVIVFEDLAYPPPVYYVQARIESGPNEGLLVDVSELIEDCVAAGSHWRKPPVVANDNYLQPVCDGERCAPLDPVKALDDSDWAVRFRAVQALPSLDADPVRLVTLLLYAKEDPDPEVAYEALESIGKLESRAEAAVPALIAAMKRHERPDGYCRRAAHALALIGRPVSPALIEALKDERWGSRYIAAEALGSLGQEAGQALPLLFELLFSLTGEEVREAPAHIGRAICRIAPDAGARQMLHLLQEGTRDEQDRVARAFTGVAPAHEEAIEPLIDFVANDRSYARAYAIEALGKYRAKASIAVPVLIRVLEQAPDSWAEASAVEALGQIGPAAKPAIPAIQRYARNGPGRAPEAAARALRQIRSAG